MSLPGWSSGYNVTFLCRGSSSVPGWAAKTPHASGPKLQTINQKQYCNKVNKDFKNCLHQRILKNRKRIYVEELAMKSDL